MIARRILEEVPASMSHPSALDPRERCDATIVLDGEEYRCARANHDGIHDAHAKHSDGGLVRW